MFSISTLTMHQNGDQIHFVERRLEEVDKGLHRTPDGHILNVYFAATEKQFSSSWYIHFRLCKVFLPVTAFKLIAYCFKKAISMCKASIVNILLSP